VYYVPESCLEPLEQAQRAFAALDGSEIPMNLNVLLPASLREDCALKFTPEGSIEQDLSGLLNLGNGFQIFAFPTIHRVASQGYCITRSEKGRLLPEFGHLTAEELKELRRAGTKLTSPSRQTLQLAYTGDTTMSGLLEGSPITLSAVLRVPVLIMEMTYLDEDPERAQKWGHVHLAEFLRESHRFSNEHIVFVHISERYQPHTKALSILRAAVPEQLQPRISVALRSFGASEDLTPLLSARTIYFRMIAEAGVGNSRKNDSGQRFHPGQARSQGSNLLEQASVMQSQQQQKQLSRRRVLGPSSLPSEAINTAWKKAGGTVLVPSAESYADPLKAGRSSGEKSPKVPRSAIVGPLCSPCDPGRPPG
jgi:LmbE family N-acetylglucosaminyl deacetylase